MRIKGQRPKVKVKKGSTLHCIVSISFIISQGFHSILVSAILAYSFFFFSSLFITYPAHAPYHFFFTF